MPEGFTSLPCFSSKVATVDSEAFIKKTNEPAERVAFHLHEQDLFDHRTIPSVPSKEGEEEQRHRGSLQVKDRAEPGPALVPGHLTPRHGEFGTWNSSGVPGTPTPHLILALACFVVSNFSMYQLLFETHF